MAEIYDIPVKKLSKKQRSILEKYSDKLDKLITLNYGDIVNNARLWRMYGYQGGAHGLRSDKKAKTEEVENAQRFLNDMNEVFQFTDKKDLVADGVYGRRTMGRVKEFQKKINELLRAYKRSIKVDISYLEKRYIATIVRSFKAKKIDLYKDKTGKYSWKSKDGKRSYELRMFNKEKGVRKGTLTVRDSAGDILKRISFKIDAKGNITYDRNSVELHEIMVDGYLGVETRRAAMALIKRRLKLDEGVVQQIAKKTPTVPGVTVKLGYSFVPYILGQRGYVLDALLHTHARGDEINSDEIKNLVNEVFDIYNNLSYEDEVKLRNSRQKIEIDGKEYNATWQEMVYARITDDVPYKKFLEKWISMLKKRGIKASKQGSRSAFSILEEKKTGRGSRIAVNIEESDITTIYKKIKNNINQTIKNPLIKNEFLETLERNYNFIVSRIRKHEKKAKSTEELLKLIKSDEVITSRFNMMYDLLGYMPSMSNYFEMRDFLIFKGEEQSFKDNLLKYIKYEWKDEKKRKMLQDAFRGWFLKPDTPLEIYEDILDKYYNKDRGSIKGSINLEKMEKDDPRIRDLFLSFMYGYQEVKIYKRRQRLIARQKKGKEKVVARR